MSRVGFTPATSAKLDHKATSIFAAEAKTRSSLPRDSRSIPPISKPRSTINPRSKPARSIPFAGSKGTEAVAVLIPRDRNSDLNSAVQRANDSLAEFQRIRHWVVWPRTDFPRTTGTRKVIKGQIAEAVKTTVAEFTKDCRRFRWRKARRR